MAIREKKSYSIKVVEKALDMLEVFSHETEEFSISHIAHMLEISRASAFRLMATFESRGYVEKSTRSEKYRVGATALETSQNLLLGLDLIRKAKPIMERLARQCDEAIYLCIPKGDKILLLDMVSSSQKVQVVSLAGKTFPSTSFAGGKVILAHSKQAESLPEFSSIQRQGYCLDRDGLDEGISCCAVPIFNKNHSICSSLCLIGPTFRILNDKIHATLLTQLISAGQLLSSRLGHSGLDLKQHTAWQTYQGLHY